jgi:nucleotide-binding universal stress UspA family protein
MTSVVEQPVTKRIAVTLDSSESGRAPLETAARLAAILGAELEGIFVEDINLIRLSGLPFLREVRPWSLDGEEISTQRMQRELRTLARRAEQMLERVARESGVSCSFHVWRGRTGVSSLASAFGAEIISLGRVSSLVSSSILARTRTFVRQSRNRETAISVLFSESEQAARAVTTACSLARDMGARLTVMLPARMEDMPVLREKARAILNLHRLVARLVPIAATDAESLRRAADASGLSILIMEADHPLLQHTDLDQCLESLFCPVLLVR